jgi:hypothetical protein
MEMQARSLTVPNFPVCTASIFSKA